MQYENPGACPRAFGASYASDVLAWMDRAKVAIEDLQWERYQSYGGVDGVVTGCEVVATDPESMRVTVGAGHGFLDGVPFRQPGDFTTANMTAPVSNPRIDTVVLVAATRTISIKTGVENVSPSAPAAADGEYKLAEIYHRVGETTILNTDPSGSAEGYVTDSRDVYA